MTERSGTSDAPLFSRDQLMGGLPARRAASAIFAIENRTARLVARSRRAIERYVSEHAAAQEAGAGVDDLLVGDLGVRRLGTALGLAGQFDADDLAAVGLQWQRHVAQAAGGQAAPDLGAIDADEQRVLPLTPATELQRDLAERGRLGQLEADGALAGLAGPGRALVVVEGDRTRLV